MKHLLSLLLSATLAIGCSQVDHPTTKGAGIVTVTMETTAGAITLELDSEKAPATVANFIEYAKAGHYDGTIFHRVIPGFMIQGGGFDTEMVQKKSNDPIKNEANNGLKNTIGTVAMARTNDPHSATSQFFINVKDNSFLDHTEPTARGWGYCVFGKVTDGLDVIHSIEKVKTGSSHGHQDVPASAIIINKVSIKED